MAETQSIKDRAGEKSLFFRRFMFSVFVLVLMAAGLLARLFYLQIISHDIYATLSTENRVQVEPLNPTRGLIYDRNGILLAENVPSHNLQLVLERIEDLDDTLADIRNILPVSEYEESRFRDRLERKRRPYEPVVLKENLSEAEIAGIAVNRYFLDGVEVNATLVRRYPYGTSFAHAVGYVGKINESELRENDPTLYAGTYHIGKTGVEKTYEKDLLGTPGSQLIETNAKGRILRVLEKTLPTPGINLNLFLDIELQQLAENLMADRRGAVVAIDPKTGGILALVSTPGFDPNSFVTGISNDEYALLRDSKDVPFLNRATRGLYPPASTIKPFLALGALAAKVTTWNYVVADPGYYILPTDESIKKRDWMEGGHASFVSLMAAITESCDTYFYDLAFRMKLETMHDSLDKFGFGRDTTLDVDNMRVGINPTRDWKKARHGFSWFAGDTVNVGIGQGYLLVNPLQLAIATTTLVNNGEWKVPRLVSSTTEPVTTPLSADIPESMVVPKGDWAKMKSAMKDVLHSSKGTARATGYGSKFLMAGKTGTAQTFSLGADEVYESADVAERLRDHGWFTGFAPYNDPSIVVTVFMENGEHGSAQAPIARELFESWILRGEGT